MTRSGLRSGAALVLGVVAFELLAGCASSPGNDAPASGSSSANGAGAGSGGTSRPEAFPSASASASATAPACDLSSLPPVAISASPSRLFPIIGSKQLPGGGVRQVQGFIDRTGRVIVRPRYEEVRGDSEGLAAVQAGDKWGFVDTAGKVVLAPRWLAVGRFSEGLASVVEETKQAGESMEDRVQVYRCGYIDKTGSFKIKPAWVHACGPFRDGRARWAPFREAAHTDKRGGFIDATGTQVFEAGEMGMSLEDPLAGPGWDFQEGFVFLPPTDDWRKGGRLLSTDGKALPIEAGWLADGPMSNGLARVRPAAEAVYPPPPRTTAGFVDGSGKLIFRVQGLVGDFHDGLAVFAAAKNGPFGYLDRCGRTVVAAELRAAKDFSEGLAVAATARPGAVVLATDGKQALQLEHEPAAPGFVGGLLRVTIQLRTINRSGPAPLEGYVDRKGGYVYLSDGVKEHLGEAWVKAHHVGPEPVR